MVHHYRRHMHQIDWGDPEGDPGDQSAGQRCRRHLCQGCRAITAKHKLIGVEGARHRGIKCGADGSGSAGGNEDPEVGAAQAQPLTEC